MYSMYVCNVSRRVPLEEVTRHVKTSVPNPLTEQVPLLVFQVSVLGPLTGSDYPGSLTLTHLIRWTNI